MQQQQRGPRCRPLSLAAAGLFYFVAWASVLLFLFWTFAVMTFWVWDWSAGSVWEKVRTALSGIDNKLQPGGYYMGGWDTTMVMFLWLPAFVCAVCMVLVSALPKRDLKGEYRISFQESFGRHAWRAVKRVAAYPLPPYNFWLNWCDGLDAKDVLLHALWFAMHVMQIKDLGAYYEEYAYKNWEAMGIYFHVPKSVLRLKAISLAFSWALYMDLAIMFFPIAHSSFIYKLLGTNFAAAVRWHRWVAHYLLLTTTGHGVFYYLYWLCSPDHNFWKEFFDWNGTTSEVSGWINYFAGSLALLFGVIIWVSSINYVRRNFFKVFYSLHIIGFAGFVIFAQVHYSWNWTVLAPGLVFYGLDVVFRTFQAQNVSVVSSAHVSSKGLLARIVVPIDAQLAQKTRAGQDVFLQFPTISRWSWHPFTVFKVTPGGNGVEASLTVVVKKYGSWTQILIEQLKMGAVMPVRVTGPFGGTEEDVSNVSQVVMFMGGVGATAALALLQNMASASSSEGVPMPPTTLVFTAREMEEFTVLDDELVLAASKSEKSWLQVALHYTGSAPANKDPPATHAKQPLTGDPCPFQSSPHASSGSDTCIEKVDAKAAAQGPQVIQGSKQASSTAPATAAPGLSAFLWNRIRPVEPKYLSALYVLAAIMLAWLGAFLGLMQAFSAVNENWWIWTDASDVGVVGFIFIILIAVQAVGLPAALLVLPTHVIRYIMSRRVHVNPLEVAEPACCYAQVLDDGRIGVPGGLSLEVQRGRPNVQAVLDAVVRAADPSKEVLVVAAGPRTLVHQVCMAAWNMNSGRGAGQPYLRVAKETYEL